MLARILVDGAERTVRDLTLAEARAIRERLGGVSYLDLNVEWDPEHRAAVLEAFLARTVGADKAKEQVEAMTGEESERLIRVEVRSGDRKGERVTLDRAVTLAFDAGEKVDLEPDDGDDDTLPTVWEGPNPLEGSGSTTTDSS